MTRTDAPRTIESVKRACEILDLLEARGPIGVSELAANMEITKGTVHCHLATLVESGYATAEDGAYRLSLKYLQLNESVKDQIDVYDLVAEELETASSALGERVQFCMEEGGEVVFVNRSSGAEAVNASVGVGGREPIHVISGGKAILAHYPRSKVEAIIAEHGLPRFTEKTITEPDALFSELEKIARQGYAIHDEERVSGVRCIAVPLFQDGTVVGALSVCGPSSRMPDERLKGDVLEELRKAVNVIEVNSTLTSE